MSESKPETTLRGPAQALSIIACLMLFAAGMLICLAVTGLGVARIGNPWMYGVVFYLIPSILVVAAAVVEAAKYRIVEALNARR